MAFKQISLNGTTYDISTKYVYATSYTGTFYPVGITTGGSNTALTYYTSSVSIRNGNSVYASGGFYESSDERLKTISDSISVNLEDLQNLRKIYYVWNDDKSKKNQIGLVAQEVQKLYPELVEVDENTGLLSLAYDKLSVVALAAIDKLHEEMCSLQKKNTELEDRINKLEKILLNGNS